MSPFSNQSVSVGFGPNVDTGLKFKEFLKSDKSDILTRVNKEIKE